ncbi:unnamed protein product [Periconia digitata]|uniref:Uncharacterized protein n=1 Tax=Periconia digitata TaxID=1303443 RepID=A0A9W4U7R0_9PLEO|nr:unnamed protein product [Periconia digitata]
MSDLNPNQSLYGTQVGMVRILKNVTDFIVNIITDAISYKAPKSGHASRNRVDAFAHLLQYHNPASGPKPEPQMTKCLPIRTKIPNLAALDDMSMAQTHAHYEEIDCVPAAALGMKSEFEGTGHWYMIHPLSLTQVKTMTTRVLEDIKN